jgi:hypothetical protein
METEPLIFDVLVIFTLEHALSSSLFNLRQNQTLTFFDLKGTIAKVLLALLHSQSE